MHSNEIHLWWIPLYSGLQEPYFAILSKHEQKRILDLKNKLRQRQRLIAYAAMRMILSKYLNQDPKKVKIEYKNNQWPYKTGNFYINLSHSFYMGVLGIAPHPMGVDVEKLRPFKQAKEVSQEVWGISLSEGEFFRRWTAHEAEFKLGHQAKGYFHKTYHEYLSCVSSSIDDVNLSEYFFNLGVFK